MKRDLTMLSLPLYNHEVGIELFTNSTRFFAHIEMSYDYVDALTYTFGRNPLTRLRRVVFNILCEIEAAKYAKELRTNTNIHTKAFLCYIDNKLVDVYAGSLNLRLGLNYNIMFRLDKKLHKPMKEYFKSLWNNSKRFGITPNADNVSIIKQKQTNKK